MAFYSLLKIGTYFLGREEGGRFRRQTGAILCYCFQLSVNKIASFDRLCNRYGEKMSFL